MKVEKYADVKIFRISKSFCISYFKNGQRKIKKSEYKNYDYDWAVNLGLFYMAFSKNKFIRGWNIDFSSNLGLLRILKK